MTAEEKYNLQRFIGLPAAAVAVLGAVVWLGSVVFVPQATYAVDQYVQQQTNDSLRTMARENRAAINANYATTLRILCYMQAQNGERATSECVE